MKEDNLKGYILFPFTWHCPKDKTTAVDKRVHRDQWLSGAGSGSGHRGGGEGCGTREYSEIMDSSVS